MQTKKATRVVEADENGDTTETYYREGQLWDNAKGNNGSNNGRGNHVTVTYKDSDGKEQKKYYNYVFKQGDKDKVDGSFNLKDSPIYLVEVKQDENGKWMEQLSDDDKRNNVANYTRLTQELENTRTSIADYRQQQDAIKAAQDEISAAEQNVKELQDKIKELENIENISDENLNKLQVDLEEAEGRLVDAETEKSRLENLKKEVENAGKYQIDLSRFNTPDTPGTPVTPVTSVTPDGPVTTVTPDGEEDEEDTTGGDEEVGGGQEEEVLGVRAGGEVEAPAPGTNARVTANNTTNSNKKKIVSIKDNAVPLAQMPAEEGIHMSWWWLLIILLLGATGKRMYDKYQEKKAAKEQGTDKIQ